MRLFALVSIYLIGCFSFAEANAQYKSPGPVGAQSTIRECFTGQGMKERLTNCSEHKAIIYNIGDRNYINQPLRVGTEYPYGFNYSSKDKWVACRETDGRSLILSGSYCKIIHGDNINYWIPGLGAMTLRWETDYDPQSSVPLNTYFYKIYTSSLPTDLDWVNNRMRQNQLCRGKGFGDALGVPIKIRYDDVIEMAYGKAPISGTDRSIPNTINSRNERQVRRNQYHLLSCNADAYLSRQQAIAKPF